MAQRRLRYSPSGPFRDDDADSASIYSVDTDGTINTSDDNPLEVQSWTVPVGADGTFLIHWYLEASAAVDTETEAVILGLVTLETDGNQVAEVAILKGGLNAPQPWFQAAGHVVRELAAGDVVQLFIQAATEGGLSARRRRLSIFPVSVLT